jgi:hypothetical protein
MADYEYNVYAKKDGVGATFVTNYLILEEPKPLEIQLQPFGAVEGYLVQGETPVKGADIILISEYNGPIPNLQYNMKAETNADGYFKHEEVPAGSYLCIHQMRSQSGGDNIYARRASVQVKPESTAFVTLGGEGKARVFGKVTNEEDAPIADLPISLVDNRNPNVKYYGTLSGGDGTFVISDVPEGNYQISAHRWSQTPGGESLNYSGVVNIADETEIEHNIEIIKQRPLSEGVVLPTLEGKYQEKEATLDDLGGNRFLYVFADPSRPEAANWIGENKEDLAGAKVKVLLLSSESTEDEIKSTAESLGYPDSVFLIDTSWLQKLVQRYRPPEDLPALLVDQEGKVLKLCRSYEDVKSGLEANP